MLSVVALAMLAVLDGAFAGFRVAAGRNASVLKWRNGYYPRAVARGALVATGMLLVPLGFAGALTVLGGGPEWVAELKVGAAGMAVVVGAYAAVVLAAFGPWLAFGVEVRTLVSVIVFGPLTLLRPVVVMAALTWSVWRIGAGTAAVVLAVGAAGVLGVEGVLRRVNGAVEARQG